MSGFIRVITGGSHRDMGVDFGRAAKHMLAAFVAESRLDFPRQAKMTVEDAKRHAARYFLPAVARRYPSYLEEVRGIAEGARLSFEDFFYLTADEELTAYGKRREKCSSAAVRDGSAIFLGHNEDYPKRYMGRLIIVDAQPVDAPAFLALTYPYLLTGPGCGLNSAGMAFAANSLNFPARGKGVPTNFILRDVYRARKLADVKKIMRVPGALMGNAVVAISSREHKALVVEASPDDVDVIPIGASPFLAHTNHVRSTALDRTGEALGRTTRSRFAALQRLLSIPKNQTLSGLQKTLSSAKDGVLRSAKKSGESCTLASAVLDPEGGIMYVAKRGPHGHGYKRYRLKA